MKPRKPTIAGKKRYTSFYIQIKFFTFSLLSSGQQKNDVKDATLSEDNHPTPDEKTNGTVEETDEPCDKKDDNTAASEVVAVENDQHQQTVKNGKGNNTNNKKNKKNAKGKMDSQINDEVVDEVNA